MPYRKTIRRRNIFVDRLTVSEVATFIGVHPRTVKKNYPDIGVLDANGWRQYTVADACLIYGMRYNKQPTAGQVGALLFEMGLRDIEEIRVIVLRLYSRRLTLNAEVNDEDLRT
jgi:hypothetical protein